MHIRVGPFSKILWPIVIMRRAHIAVYYPPIGRAFRFGGTELSFCGAGRVIVNGRFGFVLRPRVRAIFKKRLSAKVGVSFSDVLNLRIFARSSF